MQQIPEKCKDFSNWYNKLVLRAELADYAPVRGCMVVRPYGWSLWENCKEALDKRFKATGHQNAAFPIFIPKSFMEKEKEHVSGFAPELAVVTIGGGKELEEPLIVRPTSETIIGHMYSKWIKSYRDLPLLINQWGNVVRWELRTKLFLRTLEFYWQEGHTAHSTKEEAKSETIQMLDIYADFAINDAAVPVIRGRKSNSEKFAGAENSFSIEAMMGDKRALQAGTSHYFGQNFAKAFEIKYLDQNNNMQYVWTTSWGLSTRFIGAIIMIHGDDKGLILPPKLAPIQVVIIPIYKNDEEKNRINNEIEKIMSELKEFRIKVDDREEYSPGYKFNEWELRGIPIRIEIGPKEIKNETLVLARRDFPGKKGKSIISKSDIRVEIRELLDAIQKSLYTRALDFQESNIHEPEEYKEFCEVVKNGWALVWWCGDDECERRIKEDTNATNRCIPLNLTNSSGKCICCEKKSKEKAYFSRSY